MNECSRERRERRERREMRERRKRRERRATVEFSGHHPSSNERERAMTNKLMSHYR